MSNLLQSLSFQALFDAAADAMLIVNDKGHVVHSNVAAQQLLDYSMEDLYGLEVEVLMPQNCRDQHRHYRKAFYINPEKRTMSNGRELIALKRGGEEVALNISLSPIKFEDQLYTLVSFHLADRRRQAEAALIISEERLRLAKEAANLGVFDFDSKHNIIYWDNKMCEIWGGKSSTSTTYEEFIGAIHFDDRLERQISIDNAINSNSNGEYKSQYRVVNQANGIVHWVEATGRMHFEKGQITRFLGVVKDISEQKMLEHKILIQKNEMEAITKQQIASQTISAIAHNINQPLAAISAYSEVVLHELNNTTLNQEILNHALKKTISEVHRAGDSLHDLLNLLRKDELVTEQFDLNDLVINTLDFIKTIEFRKFQPILKLEKNMPNVLGNKSQIQKILTNILQNSIEAIYSLEVLNSKITVIVRTNNDFDMAHVTIKDNGPGLNLKNKVNAFKPFFTTKSDGIGLGLVISRGLAEMNGGQLWFDENSSSGATIHFTLPFAK